MLNFFNIKAQCYYGFVIKMVIIVVTKWRPKNSFDRLIRSK